ncbi:hypothetical protein [Helicobacter sp. T3_23-1056]
MVVFVLVFAGGFCRYILWANFVNEFFANGVFEMIFLRWFWKINFCRGIFVDILIFGVEDFGGLWF